MSLIIQALPAAEYHARPELNFSRLKRFARSPFHFKASVPETSSGFALGGAAHTAILEPDKWATRYMMQSANIRRGKAWDEELACAQAGGYEILREDEYEKASTIAERARSRPYIRNLLAACPRKELTIISEIEGLPVRCRVDFAGQAAKGDLKTCRDLSRFSSDVERYMYLAQAAFYSDICATADMPAAPWKWIVIENAEPHDMAVIVPSPGDLSAGRDLYMSWLAQYKTCADSGEWPGFDGGAEEVALVRPRWATRAGEADDAVGGYDLTEETSDEA